MQEIRLHTSVLGGEEEALLLEVLESKKWSGNGTFTERCEMWLQEQYGGLRVLLTHSCTAALEMSAMLLGISEGDEVILPSFTHPSTANAFLLRGAKLVFVDVEPETLTLNYAEVERAITPRTKVIIPVHYAGMAGDLNVLLKLAQKHSIAVVEDAAQALHSFHRGKALGTIGTFGCLSFHDTKHIGCGEGGALIVNEQQYLERAENIREKGTNRFAFLRGEVSKYEWVDVGSSYIPSEFVAAVLLAQLHATERFTKTCLSLWETYTEYCTPLAEAGHVQLPGIPGTCTHNAHLYYMLLENPETRDALIEHLKKEKIQSAFHFVPLHSAPMGQLLGYGPDDFPVTQESAKRLLRLPCHPGMTQADAKRVADTVSSFYAQKYVTKKSFVGIAP